MCVRGIMVKSSSQDSPQFAFVPCGKCEECRDVKKSQWTFRLRTELDWCRSQGWNIGFFTLTYNDSHLPHIPKACFRDSANYRVHPCFSRYDVRTFIDNIRKRMHERYGVKSLRYMICSEYGDNTARPHYHGILSFPSTYEVIDKTTGEVTVCPLPSTDVFELIRDNWTDKGFVFPKHFLGGVDRSGYCHKPFLLQGDTEGVANYAAKYCCKDMTFYDSIKDLDVVQSLDLFKQCRPFHCQSRGIGRTFLCNKDSKTLLELLKRGESFIGQMKTKSVPLYIKNKILYDIDYQFMRVEDFPPDAHKKADWIWNPEKQRFTFKRGQGTHCRLVRRKATEFFNENYKEIYEQKREYYVELFSQMTTPSFWSQRLDPKCNLHGMSYELASNLSKLPFDVDKLSNMYMAYYGLPVSRCRSDVAYSLQWFSRYSDVPAPCHDEPWSLVDEDELRAMNSWIALVFSQLRYCSSTDDEQRKKVRKMIDYYKHMT